MRARGFGVNGAVRDEVIKFFLQEQQLKMDLTLCDFLCTKKNN